MTNPVETTVAVGKYASIISHVKNNRTEYLILSLAIYVTGIADKIFAQTSGVCF